MAHISPTSGWSPSFLAVYFHPDVVGVPSFRAKVDPEPGGRVSDQFYHEAREARDGLFRAFGKWVRRFCPNPEAMRLPAMTILIFAGFLQDWRSFNFSRVLVPRFLGTFECPGQLKSCRDQQHDLLAFHSNMKTGEEKQDSE